MNEGQERRRYMAGDTINLELVLEHRMNLSRVFVAFSHERDHLTEFYFETASFLPDRTPSDGAKRSRVILEAPVPPEILDRSSSCRRASLPPTENTLTRWSV